MATYTFDTLINVVDEAYDILAVDGDSNTFPGLARANFNKFANRFSKEFVDEVRMRTQEQTHSFVTVADTTLNDASASAGDTTVTIASSTGWPASGLCLIDNVPMTFTRSGLVLTVSALTRDFDDGAIVQLAYAVPSDYWRTQSMIVEGVQYGYQRRGDKQNVPAQHFSLYGDYIVFPVAATGDVTVVHHYYEKPAGTLASSDTMDIMDMWDHFVIYKLVAHGHDCMYDSDRAMKYEEMAMMVKRKAKAHFARIDAGTNNRFIPDF